MLPWLSILPKLKRGATSKHDHEAAFLQLALMTKMMTSQRQREEAEAEEVAAGEAEGEVDVEVLPPIPVEAEGEFRNSSPQPSALRSLKATKISSSRPA
jgi:hypothetical protein